MKLKDEIDLQDCPLCGGPALLEQENGWCCYVTCLDCGCHTAEVAYENNTEEGIFEASKKAVHLWNIGKVLSHSPGE